VAPRNDGKNAELAKIFFIIFVDGIFTSLFERLFTNSFDAAGVTLANPCVYQWRTSG
jgi:hypothetical protein